MQSAAQQDYGLQETVYRLVQGEPEMRGHLRAMIQYEDKHANDTYYSGWEWDDVGVPPGTINRLIVKGIVRKTGKTRTYRTYQLVSHDDVREGLECVFVENTPVAANMDALFSVVIGHQAVKTILRSALAAVDPVHVILVGPPACAKSVMLDEIGRLPGAQFYVGSTTRKGGLVEMLLSVQPKILVIDEFDKMAAEDQFPLLNLMQTGLVTRLIHGARDRVQMDTRVFAGANVADKIKPEIMSRFARVNVAAYGPMEFVEVVRQVLIQQHNYGPEMALLIARSVVQHSTDVRDAIRVARMCRNDPRRLLEIVQALWPSKPQGVFGGRQ